MCSPARSVRQTAPRPARRQRCSGKTVNGQTTTYTTQTASNRLSSLAGAEAKNFVYDPAGNLIQDGTATYTYDNAGRRTGATVSGQTWQYAYNALGQRVKKSGPTTTLYAYDEQGRLLGEYGATGQPLQETVWLDDLPVATLRGSAVYYVHADHLGTPRRITRPADNTVMWQWESEPFGYSNPNENPQGQGTFTYNLRFPGQLRDAETGLFYNYFRDYDPQTGRYVQSDPIGLEGGINTYAYVDNAPTMYTDPEGLEPKSGRGFSTYYGNWCGKKWSGGQAGQNIPSNPDKPTDSLDACCMQHDYCYSKLENGCTLSKEEKKKAYEQCNAELAKCARALSNNGAGWPTPPSNASDAYLYKQKLQAVFK